MFTKFFKKRPLSGWGMLVTGFIGAAIAHGLIWAVYGVYLAGCAGHREVAEFFMEQRMRNDVAYALNRLERVGYDQPLLRLMRGQRRVDELLSPWQVGLNLTNEAHVHTHRGVWRTQETSLCLLLNAIRVRTVFLQERPTILPSPAALSNPLDRMGQDYDERVPRTVHDIVTDPSFPTWRKDSSEAWVTGQLARMLDLEGVRNDLSDLLGGPQDHRIIENLERLLLPDTSLPDARLAREEYGYLADTYNRLSAAWGITQCSWPNRSGNFLIGDDSDESCENADGYPERCPTGRPTIWARSVSFVASLPEEMPERSPPQ